jgi:hypothetical protein
MRYKPSAIVLSSLIIGLLVSPLGYIAIGALGGFSIAFSILSLPLLTASILFLIFRFIPKAPSIKNHQKWLLGLEGVSWLLVGLFLFFVSGFTLITTWEQIGLFCIIWAAASLLATPFTCLRSSALLTRVMNWPEKFVLACSLIILATLITFISIYILTPSHLP